MIYLPCPITIAPSLLDSFPRSRCLRVSAGATMYELLSVAETAGLEEIKAPYRRQARRWQPDACHGADSGRSYFVEKFMRAREAYEVLSDPELRRDYDRALLRTAGGWAAAVGGGVMFRRGRRRRGERGFGDWEGPLEELAKAA